MPDWHWFDGTASLVYEEHEQILERLFKYVRPSHPSILMSADQLRVVQGARRSSGVLWQARLVRVASTRDLGKLDIVLPSPPSQFYLPSTLSKPQHLPSPSLSPKPPTALPLSVLPLPLPLAMSFFLPPLSSPFDREKRDASTRIEITAAQKQTGEAGGERRGEREKKGERAKSVRGGQGRRGNKRGYGTGEHEWRVSIGEERERVYICERGGCQCE